MSKKSSKNVPFALHGVSIFRKRCKMVDPFCGSFGVKILLGHIIPRTPWHAKWKVVLLASWSPIDNTGIRSTVRFVFKLFTGSFTLHMPLHEVEGLAAGKLVADRQYRYTCSQIWLNCDLRPAEKNGMQVKTERRTVIKRNEV